MTPPSDGGTTTLKFKVATRGLVGLRNNLLTATRGLGQLSTIFTEYGPQVGSSALPGWRAAAGVCVLCSRCFVSMPLVCILLMVFCAFIAASDVVCAFTASALTA